jgi:hypothetical protein
MGQFGFIDWLDVTTRPTGAAVDWDEAVEPE